ncbi:hypothetical protein [Moritella sp. Urea-trap-13]|uniref:hypothetical protein n=1 Tax=Moritella sp. Urea-trap-13 TaxID=2058327 RepID=UPI000C330A4B|nr:hypothetical protein [Moritella sp. Urea-trap-13]PKH06161.1 hypothetical protein CXF93_09525 [Moritella sp. Urea-trap-13]
MNNLNHKVGVKEQNLVVRNIKLSKLNEQNKTALLEVINQTFGVDAVNFNQEKSTLHLAYDATNINLDGIEAIITQHGAEIHDDWWTHIKEDYYKFIDQNVKDNAEHKPWSCHQPPKKLGPKSRTK